METERRSGTEWLYVVRVSVDPALEEEWNEWYDGGHLPEILACPGFVHGSRYVSESEAGRSYMTVYTIADPTTLTTAEFEAAKGWHRFAPAVDFTTEVYRAVAPAPS
jgi:hypothetical protein